MVLRIFTCVLCQLQGDSVSNFLLILLCGLQAKMPQGIIYPQGCRPIQEELGADELIRRLKVTGNLHVSTFLFSALKFGLCVRLLEDAH